MRRQSLEIETGQSAIRNGFVRDTGGAAGFGLDNNAAARAAFTYGSLQAETLRASAEAH